MKDSKSERARKSTRKPSGYIQKSLTLSKESTEYLRNLVAHFDDATQGLFFHLIACTLNDAWNPWIPVSSYLIQYDLRGARWKDLERQGLIEVSDYSSVKGRSRSFRPKDFILDTVLEKEPSTAQEARSARWRNVMTGRAAQKRRTALYDDSRNLIGGKDSPLSRGLRTYASMSVPFSAPAVEDHLKRLERQTSMAEQAWMSSGVGMLSDEFVSFQASAGPREAEGFNGEKFTQPYRVFLRNRSRWLNDFFCYQAVLRQGPTPAPDLGPGIYRYQPAYEPQTSGRVHQLSGGFQSCSRGMKEAAYAGIPGLRNYDLKASQPNILLQLYAESPEEYRPDSSWLERYLHDDNAKLKHAAEAGVPVDTWKRTLCAVMMGANLPGDIRFSSGAVSKELIRIAPDKLEATYRRLQRALEGFYESHRSWLEFVEQRYFDMYGALCKGGRFISNASGAVLLESHLAGCSEFQRCSKIVAFLLQGQEAAFIHSLAALGDKYDFQVIANEHDGLVTIGTIPDKAVSEAAEQSGLRQPVLIEKPFVSRQSESTTSTVTAPGGEYVMTSSADGIPRYVSAFSGITPVFSEFQEDAITLDDPEIYEVLTRSEGLGWELANFWTLAGHTDPTAYYGSLSDG